MSDLISKAEVLSLLESMMETYWDRKQILNIVRNNIEKLPSAETRGRWKIKKASIHPYGNDVCCSVCGYTMGSSFGYKYCPNCGARMEMSE